MEPASGVAADADEMDAAEKASSAGPAVAAVAVDASAPEVSLQTSTEGSPAALPAEATSEAMVGAPAEATEAPASPAIAETIQASPSGAETMVGGPPSPTASAPSPTKPSSPIKPSPAKPRPKSPSRYSPVSSRFSPPRDILSAAKPAVRGGAASHAANIPFSQRNPYPRSQLEGYYDGSWHCLLDVRAGSEPTRLKPHELGHTGRLLLNFACVWPTWIPIPIVTGHGVQDRSGAQAARGTIT